MVSRPQPEPSSAAVPAGVREAALAAATRLFAARGFDATALQAVADEIGVTKQAILHHFPSKERLRDAVLEAMLAHWNDTLPRLLVAATASEGRFDAVFGEVRRFFAADPDRARLVVRELLDRPDDTGRRLRGPVHTWVAAISRYIREGQATGRHFPDVDPEAYVVHMLCFVIAAAAAAPVTAGAIEAGGPGSERAGRELVRIAKAALFAPRPPEPRRRKRR
jgi:TetR/AcrR family transcriptional regulator